MVPAALQITRFKAHRVIKKGKENNVPVSISKQKEIRRTHEAQCISSKTIPSSSLPFPTGFCLNLAGGMSFGVDIAITSHPLICVSMSAQLQCQVLQRRVFLHSDFGSPQPHADRDSSSRTRSGSSRTKCGSYRTTSLLLGASRTILPCTEMPLSTKQHTAKGRRTFKGHGWAQGLCCLLRAP